MAHIGRLHNIWIWKETTKWTQVNPAIWIPKINGELKPVIEKVKDNSTFGIIDEIAGSRISKQSSELSLSWIVRDKSIGYLLLATFGTVASTVKAGETLVYQHLFTRKNDNDHPSLTVWGQDPVWTQVATYMMMDEFDIEASAWEFVKFTGKMKWKAITSWTTQSVSYVWENDFIASNCKVYFADNLAGLDSAIALNYENFKFTIKKNLELYQFLGSTDIWKIANQNFSCTWDIETLFEDTTLRDYVLNWNKKAMRIEIISTANIWTSSHPSIIIDFAQIGFDDWGQNSDNDKLISQTIWFEWEFSLTESKMVTAKLLNLQTAY